MLIELEGKLLSVGLLKLLSWRNVICSKNRHFGKVEAAGPDLVRRLRIFSGHLSCS